MSTPAVEQRLTNLLAVVALAISDQVRNNTEDVAGLGSAAPAALVALAEFANGTSVEHLRDVLGLTHSGCVRLVDRLASTGLTERRPGSDGRTISVVLTRTGLATARRIRRSRAQTVEALLVGLDHSEQRRLLDLIARLLGTATRQRLEARAEGSPPAAGWLCRLCDFTACGRAHGLCPVAAAAAATNEAHRT